jgi:polyhydroxybutyrate depolymerase
MRHIGVGLLIVTLASLVTACDRDPAGDDPPPESTTTSAAETATANAAPKPSSGCTSREPRLPAGRSEHHTTVNGEQRRYLAYAPTSAPDTPRPLVFNIHGYGSGASEQVAYTGIEPVAEREDFVTVAPQGRGDPAAFDIIGLPDVTFIGQLIDEVAASACIDLARVYSMGMSNGGGMSAALGCRLADRLAAVAPVTLVIYAAPFCDGTTPTPIATFMGTADPVIPFNGGRINCCGAATIRGAPEIMADWARHNGCDGEPTTEDIASDVEKRTWNGCDSAADTDFYVIEDGGHTWPGSFEVSRLGKTTQSINATETIWSFFAEHHRG